MADGSGSVALAGFALGEVEVAGSATIARQTDKVLLAETLAVVSAVSSERPVGVAVAAETVGIIVVAGSAFVASWAGKVGLASARS